MEYHVHIFGRKTLGLVFWAWEIGRVDALGNLHVEVTGLNSNSYKGACDAVEREIDAHYRPRETA